MEHGWRGVAGWRVSQLVRQPAYMILVDEYTEWSISIDVEKNIFSIALYCYYRAECILNTISWMPVRLYMSRPGIGARGRDTKVLGSSEGRCSSTRAVLLPEGAAPARGWPQYFCVKPKGTNDRRRLKCTVQSHSAMNIWITMIYYVENSKQFESCYRQQI